MSCFTIQSYLESVNKNKRPTGTWPSLAAPGVSLCGKARWSKEEASFLWELTNIYYLSIPNTGNMFSYYSILTSIKNYPPGKPRVNSRHCGWCVGSCCVLGLVRTNICQSLTYNDLTRILLAWPCGVFVLPGIGFLESNESLQFSWSTLTFSL